MREFSILVSSEPAVSSPAVGEASIVLGRGRLEKPPFVLFGSCGMSVSISDARFSVLISSVGLLSTKYQADAPIIPIRAKAPITKRRTLILSPPEDGAGGIGGAAILSLGEKGVGSGPFGIEAFSAGKADSIGEGVGKAGAGDSTIGVVASSGFGGFIGAGGCVKSGELPPLACVIFCSSSSGDPATGAGFAGGM